MSQLVREYRCHIRGCDVGCGNDSPAKMHNLGINAQSDLTLTFRCPHSEVWSLPPVSSVLNNIDNNITILVVVIIIMQTNY